MKILSLILLLMISTNVMAEWIVVGGNDDVGITTYADFGTIKRKGNKMKMWVFTDFKTVQKVENYRYLSEMRRYEYDCKEETSRQLDIYFYSGNMKQGEIVVSAKNIKIDEATSILPGSIDETLFKITCSKK